MRLSAKINFNKNMLFLYGMHDSMDIITILLHLHKALNYFSSRQSIRVLARKMRYRFRAVHTSNRSKWRWLSQHNSILLNEVRKMAHQIS